jgi:hypothetical protein
MKPRINKNQFVFDRPESRDIAEYIGKNGCVDSIKLRELFKGDMSDSYFKSILQCLVASGVVTVGGWTRPKGQQCCRQYEATPTWRKALEAAVEVRRVQNMTPSKGRPRAGYVRITYPTGEWLPDWKPFRDPMHTLLMGKV